jgi:hypothetical protein
VGGALDTLSSTFSGIGGGIFGAGGFGGPSQGGLFGGGFGGLGEATFGIAEDAKFSLIDGASQAAGLLAEGGTGSSQNLIGGLAKGLSSIFGGSGGGGDILSGILGIVGSLFGGGGGGGLFGSGGGSGGGSGIPGFAEGGHVPPMDHSALRSRPDAIGHALRQEGHNSILAALTPEKEFYPQHKPTPMTCKCGRLLPMSLASPMAAWSVATRLHRSVVRSWHPPTPPEAIKLSLSKPLPVMALSQ